MVDDNHDPDDGFRRSAYETYRALKRMAEERQREADRQGGDVPADDHGAEPASPPPRPGDVKKSSARREAMPSSPGPGWRS